MRASPLDDIHEECPDCRGTCSPVEPTAPADSTPQKQKRSEAERMRERDDVQQPTECPKCQKPYVFIPGIYRPAPTCNCGSEPPSTEWKLVNGVEIRWDEDAKVFVGKKTIYSQSTTEETAILAVKSAIFLLAETQWAQAAHEVEPEATSTRTEMPPKGVEAAAREIVDKIFEETHDGMSLAEEYRTAIKCAEIVLSRHLQVGNGPDWKEKYESHLKHVQSACSIAHSALAAQPQPAPRPACPKCSPCAEDDWIKQKAFEEDGADIRAGSSQLDPRIPVCPKCGNTDLRWSNSRTIIYCYKGESYPEHSFNVSTIESFRQFFTAIPAQKEEK